MPGLTENHPIVINLAAWFKNTRANPESELVLETEWGGA